MKRAIAVATFWLALPAAAHAAEPPAPGTYGEVMRWYRKAAEQGLPKAQFFLGLMYERGEGRPKDPAKALGWYRRAAEQGFALAQFKLGTFLAHGVAGPRDAEAAAEWYRRAATQGLGVAAYNLGLLYATGDGVAHDPVTGWAWLERAVHAGTAGAAAARDTLAKRMDAAQLDAARALAEKLSGR